MDLPWTYYGLIYKTVLKSTGEELDDVIKNLLSCKIQNR